LHGIPGTIVQGQWDVVTPVVTAWQLHQSWPGSTLRIVPEAGHASSDMALRLALIQALDEMAEMTINNVELSMTS
jgi:proline iminopeptidase